MDTLVYVLKQCYDYEGFSIIGIFTDEDTAIKEGEKLNASGAYCDRIIVCELSLDKIYDYDGCNKVKNIK